nr:sushi domain-containing protein 1-like [Salvelinus alpinus]
MMGLTNTVDKVDSGKAKCGLATALAYSEEMWQNTRVVFHHCLEGFHSWRGRNTSVCDITGKWQASTLQCQEIKPAISDLVVLMKNVCVGMQTSMKKTQNITE